MLKDRYLKMLPLTSKEIRIIKKSEKETKVNSFTFALLDFFDTLYSDVKIEIRAISSGYVYLNHQFKLFNLFSIDRQAEIHKMNEDKFQEVLSVSPLLQESISNLFEDNAWGAEAKNKCLKKNIIRDYNELSYDELYERTKEILYKERNFALITLEVVGHYTQNKKHKDNIYAFFNSLITAFGYYFEVSELFQVEKSEFMEKAQQNIVFLLGKKILIENKLWDDSLNNRDIILKYIMATGIIEEFYNKTLSYYEMAKNTNELLIDNKSYKHICKILGLLTNQVNEKIEVLEKMFSDK